MFAQAKKYSASHEWTPAFERQTTLSHKDIHSIVTHPRELSRESAGGGGGGGVLPADSLLFPCQSRMGPILQDVLRAVANVTSLMPPVCIQVEHQANAGNAA